MIANPGTVASLANLINDAELAAHEVTPDETSAIAFAKAVAKYVLPGTQYAGYSRIETGVPFLSRQKSQTTPTAPHPPSASRSLWPARLLAFMTLMMPVMATASLGTWFKGALHLGIYRERVATLQATLSADHGTWGLAFSPPVAVKLVVGVPRSRSLGKIRSDMLYPR